MVSDKNDLITEYCLTICGPGSEHGGRGGATECEDCPLGRTVEGDGQDELIEAEHQPTGCECEYPWDCRYKGSPFPSADEVFIDGVRAGYRLSRGMYADPDGVLEQLEALAAKYRGSPDSSYRDGALTVIGTVVDMLAPPLSPGAGDERVLCDGCGEHEDQCSCAPPAAGGGREDSISFTNRAQRAQSVSQVLDYLDTLPRARVVEGVVSTTYEMFVPGLVVYFEEEYFKPGARVTVVIEEEEVDGEGERIP